MSRQLAEPNSAPDRAQATAPNVSLLKFAPTSLEPLPSWIESRPRWFGSRDELREYLRERLPDLPRDARHYLAELCLDAAKKLGFACARQSSYAARVECSERTLRRHRRLLENRGLVFRVDTQGVDRSYINWPALELDARESFREVAPDLAGRTGQDGRSYSLDLKSTLPQTRERARGEGEESSARVLEDSAPNLRKREVGRQPSAPASASTALVRSLPPVEPHPGHLAAVLREHGVEVEAVVRGVLAEPEARAHPEAALSALEALTSYGRDDVRSTVLHLFRWLVREHAAGRCTRNLVTSGPRANTGMARLQRAIDDATQTGRLEEASALRAAAFHAGRAADKRIDALELEDPGHARAQAIIDAVRAGQTPRRIGYAPQPRELAAPKPTGDRFLARAIGRVLSEGG